jgi:diguanylate cyclase (GGDEF)-like protein
MLNSVSVYSMLPVVSAATALAGAGVGWLAARRFARDRFDADERDTLHAIATHRPINEIIDRLAAAVSRMHRAMRMAVIIRRGGITHCYGNLPADTRRTLERSNPSAVIGELGTFWSYPITAEPAATLVIFPGAGIRTWSERRKRLARRCARLLAMALDREQLTDRLASQSLLDPLTELPNRMLTHDRLNQALKRARRAGTQLAVFLVDLDGFKALNDSLGNQHGDAVLRQAAERLKVGIRASDTLGRVGPDQFALVAADVAEGVDTHRAIQIVADRLLLAFKQPYLAAGKPLTVSASIGVAMYPADGNDINALLRNADTALLYCKRQHRGRYRMFETSMNEATVERLEMESHLRLALQNEELSIAFQPMCDTAGQVVAVEALARWMRNGMPVAPSRFIPIAEESGLIVPLGNWMLNEACRWCRAWQDQGRSPIRVAVNVSALQFAQDDFLNMVRRALVESRLDARWLEIEITESLLMHNAASVAAKLTSLRDIGVMVAIDDFGTGYSSLAYLQKLPIDILKIDRSFVKDIPADEEHLAEKTAVIRAIVLMAHSLQLQVVAEGVECEAHFRFLKQVGCHQLQGYYFSAPRTPEEIAATIDRINARASQVVIAA